MLSCEGFPLASDSLPQPPDASPCASDIPFSTFLADFFQSDSAGWISVKEITGEHSGHLSTVMICFSLRLTHTPLPLVFRTLG